MATCREGLFRQLEFFLLISKEFCIYNKTLITVKMSGKYKLKTYYVGIS